MRVGRKGEQYVFAHLVRQVHGFGAGEVDLGGEIVDAEWVGEAFEAGAALEAEVDGEPAGGEEAAVGEADIEGPADGGEGTDGGVVELKDGGRVFALEVETLVGDLVLVDFHEEKSWKSIPRSRDERLGAGGASGLESVA